MRERLRPADYRFLAICLILLALTTWFSVRYFHRAFPEASIDFRVNREQAADLASRFLAGEGLKPETFRHAARFGFDNQAKVFLERELGLEQANRVMGSQVRLWRWSNRWFRPQDKEELQVEITPSGELAGFEHQIPEAARRASLSPEQARAAAEDFLRRRLHRDPAGLEFLEGARNARPARVDQVFTWKQRGLDIHGATYRFEVSVLGSEVGGYREYLKIPETWTRSYEALRSRNQAAQVVDTAAVALLGVGLLAALLLRIRRRDVRWGPAGLIGMTGSVLLFLSNWNSFPQAEFFYPTTDSYASFFTAQLLQNLLSSAAAGVLLFVLTAAAEPLYREFIGRQLTIGSLFTLRGLRTRSFLRGGVLGLSLTGIFVAYQIAFYMLAYRFGAWSPADVPYDDLLNTRFPWLFVLFGGFLPAVSEEFLFRMFAIPAIRKVVRFTWLALILAGFLWGFGHAGYPQQPFWIRGVEVGMGGVALGLVMLKWGILPTLIWHYSVDAMYTALLLMRSHSTYFQLSGLASAGIMVLPVAFALFEYWRRGGFEPETGLTNQEHAAPAEEAEHVPEADAAPAPAIAGLDGRRRVLAAVLGALGLATLFVPVSRLGDRPRYSLSQERILAAAAQFAQARGFDSRSYRVLAYPAEEWDDNAGKYLLEHRGVKTIAELCGRYFPLRSWVVRYYKPLEREELRISLHPESGAVLSFDHGLPEDRPGAALPAEQAQTLAVAFARASGFDTAAMDLKESSSHQRKIRRDYFFTWEARPGDARNVDQARYRVQIGVSGDRVTRERAFWKIPESFERARGERNFVSILAMILRIGVGAGIAVLWLGILIDGTRKRTVRWGKAALIALPFALLTMVGAFLRLPQAYRNYDTAIPLGTFQAILYTGLAISPVGAFVLCICAAALLLALRPEGLRALSRAGRAALGPDALLTAWLAAGAAAFVVMLRAWLEAGFPAQGLPDVNSPEIIASLFPALSILAGATQSSLLMLALVALGGRLFGLTWQRRWPVALGFLGVAMFLLPGQVHTPGEVLVYLAWRGAEVLLVAAVCLLAARKNVLAYVLSIWLLHLGGGAVGLMAQGNAGLQVQAWILIAVMLFSAAWASGFPGSRRAALS